MWGRYIRSEFSFQWNLRGARPTATAQPARMGGLYVKGVRGRRAGGRLVRNSSAENGSREYPDPALNAAGTAAPIHMPRRRPEVHPPAHAVPNPTRKLPTTSAMNPFSVPSAPHLRRSSGTSPAKSRMPRAASSARVADAIGTRRRRSVRRTAARLPPCRRGTRGSIHVAPHVVAEVIQPRPHARCAQMAEIAREAKRTIAGDEQRRHHQADERSGDVHGQSPESHSFISISVAP